MNIVTVAELRELGIEDCDLVEIGTSLKQLETAGVTDDVLSAIGLGGERLEEARAYRRAYLAEKAKVMAEMGITPQMLASEVEEYRQAAEDSCGDYSVGPSPLAQKLSNEMWQRAEARKKAEWDARPQAEKDARNREFNAMLPR